ncbi:hypothetical protein MAR_008296 [Mya arenaria]|uniref:Uncharacterized protein n=1 Tax=Mya arenaria TaxID=6604 RepID=A0ABY7DVK3_MYAAR|nr:hypothetical protein MAR_008296 [Mya arenaria]
MANSTVPTHVVTHSNSTEGQNGTPETPIPSTSGTVQTRTAGKKMLVSMPFVKRRGSGSIKAKAKALASSKRQIKALRVKLMSERKAKKRWQTRYERMNKPSVKTPTKHKEEQKQNMLRTMTRHDMRRVGIKPSKVTRQLFKKLTLSNCLVAEIKSARLSNKSPQSRKHISTIASGHIVKKYKCMSYLNNVTGISRRQHANISETAKLLTRHKVCRSTLQSRNTKKNVSAFYVRDDVSRCMPGKRDATKVLGQKVQTRILNDCLHNLLEKFLSENPNSKFCRLRPKNIKLTSLLSRNTCLCTSHQNMALKLKCLRNMGIDISPNPEVVSRTITYTQMEDYLNHLTAEEIEYEVWQKVDVDGKKRMRVVKAQKAREKFKTLLLKEFEIQAADVISNFDAKVLAGTMKVHAYIRISEDDFREKHHVTVRSEECITGLCNGWTESNKQNMTVDTTTEVKESPVKIGNYVAAINEQEWFIGQITDVDDSDKTVEIKYMEKKLLRGKTHFKWPTKEDVLWLDYDAILMSVDDPRPVDRFQRFLMIAAADLLKIQDLFN